MPQTLNILVQMLNRLEGHQKERLKNIISDHLKYIHPSETSLTGWIQVSKRLRASSIAVDYIAREENRGGNSQLAGKRARESVVKERESVVSVCQEGRRKGRTYEHILTLEVTATSVSACQVEEGKRVRGSTARRRPRNARGALALAWTGLSHAPCDLLPNMVQRHASKPVPCNVEPNFDDTFLFHLPAGEPHFPSTGHSTYPASSQTRIDPSRRSPPQSMWLSLSRDPKIDWAIHRCGADGSLVLLLLPCALTALPRPEWRLDRCCGVARPPAGAAP
eukprot:755467-Hanusia_phi.AAC.2